MLKPFEAFKPFHETVQFLLKEGDVQDLDDWNHSQPLHTHYYKFRKKAKLSDDNYLNGSNLFEPFKSCRTSRTDFEEFRPVKSFRSVFFKGALIF